MWIRRTAQEIAEAPAKRQRAEQRLRASPVTALAAALVGFLFQAPGCSRDFHGNLLSWAESVGWFLAIFAVCYVVQVLFGPVVVEFMASNGGSFGTSSVEPSALTLCPGCQQVLPRPLVPGATRCPKCGGALEALEGWKWLDEDATPSPPEADAGGALHAEV